MLQKDYFLGDRVRVLEEIVLIHLFDSVSTSCRLSLVSNSLNVHKMEEVRGGHNLSRIIEQNSESTIR